MQGYRVPYEPETVSAKITEPAGENSRVSGWQQYFDGVYYGVILADTVVRVWSIGRETRRGGSIRCRRRRSCGKGALSFWSRSRQSTSANVGTFDARQMDAIRRCIEISIGQAIPEREKLP